MAITLLVAFWCGMAYEIENRPPRIVYVTKADRPINCPLIDRIRKPNKEKQT